MVTRFRCLVLGELPDGLEPKRAIRAGIDGLIVPSTSSVVAAESYPYALHLHKHSSHAWPERSTKHLTMENRPLVFAEGNINAPANTVVFEIWRENNVVTGPLGSFPFVRPGHAGSPADFQKVVAGALNLAILETLQSRRSNALLVLDEWDGWNDEYLQALDLGLIEGASILPAKPVPGYFPESAFAH